MSWEEIDWKNINDIKSLPDNVFEYVKYIEELTKTPICMISFG